MTVIISLEETSKLYLNNIRDVIAGMNQTSFLSYLPPGEDKRIKTQAMDIIERLTGECYGADKQFRDARGFDTPEDAVKALGSLLTAMKYHNYSGDDTLAKILWLAMGTAEGRGSGRAPATASKEERKACMTDIQEAAARATMRLDIPEPRKSSRGRG